MMKSANIQRCLLMVVVYLLCTGCSTISFSRKDAPFDGSQHAVSGLICAGYWSDRNAQRQSKSRSFPARTGATLGLVAYGLIDMPFSILGDVVFLVPNVVIRGGPRRAAFDVKDHALPWRCGSLQHSINTVSAL